MNISDLQNKSIVDITTGKNLGKIIIEKKRNFFKFLFNGETTNIKWNNIDKIGEDVILIKVDNR